jgi:bacillolysin
MRKRWVPFAIMLLLLLSLFAPAAAGAQGGATSGFRALSEAEAAAFKLPGDVRLVASFELPVYGLTYERYQQVFGETDAEVLGGQFTLLKSGADTRNVIGAYYPSISPTNAVNLTAAQARQRAASDIGAEGERITTLMINPGSGRYFFQVETRRADARWFHWIDAANGALLNRFNAFMDNCDASAAPCGFGVQYTTDPGDVKDLTGLTTTGGGGFVLRSADGRQETHDQGSTRRPFLGPVASDADNSWTALGDVSPAQQALVDAQYYANVTDDYYLSTFGYDWVAQALASGANDRMVMHAHYSVDYNNAGWNGTYVVLGDGDQVSFEELTALDVVGHELTHGVTDFTSDLIYQDESGALNEAFSDMMGSSMEFWAEANGREPAVSLAPDWLIGEDFDLTNDTVPGFRNMADPGEDGDPSHYAERYTGTSDNGGVHINSGIANHWYYLLVNGGQNSDPTFASGTDVNGIGLAEAERVAFLGFTALNADATFCDARAATISVAGGFAANTADAWDEVGVTESVCSGGPTPTPAPTATPTATPTPEPGGFTLSVNAYKVRGVQTADLSWSGASSENVDVYRDGSAVATTLNDGFYTDPTGQKGGGSAVYQVCEAGSATCSNEVTVSY